MTDDEIIELTRKFAILNALKHKGKADARAVVGKILAERPELRPKAKDLGRFVANIVEEVNRIPFSEQLLTAEKNWPELVSKEKLVVEKGLPPLPSAENYQVIVTRFSPNPDCVLHLGSIRAAILSHDYARKGSGKFYLRFEDTDPRIKKPSLEFYEAIKEDLLWLGCEWDEIVTQSERLPIYYEHARRIIEGGGAYVCTCRKEEFTKYIVSSNPCPCRYFSPAENVTRWNKMLNGSFREGEAIVRIRTDLQHPNPAVRDWPAFRIIDTIRNPHPLVGSNYFVWPLYNLAAGIDDHLMGITHIIRGKEHYTNMVRQKFLYDNLGWEYPEAIHYGRLRIEGTKLSKSIILKSVAEGLVSGFSDPRLPTLKALRRRGFSPETFRRIVYEIGIKPVDAALSWENIYAVNRKIIDPSANRYFFVVNPTVLCVRGVEGEVVATVSLHPDQPTEKRALKVTAKDGVARIICPKDDFQRIGAIVRLIGLFNVRVDSISEDHVEASLHSTTFDDVRELRPTLVQWLPEDDKMSDDLIMPTGNVIAGLGEASLIEEMGKVVQLMRIGFGRVELEQSRIRVYFAHS